MQRSEKWKAHRLVTLTGTRCASLMGSAATRKTLLVEMLREYLTASSKDFVKSKAMEKGVDDEPLAESAYSIYTGNTVEGSDSYIVKHNDPFCAVSPDGLIADDGAIEIKNLAEENHLKVILDGKPEKKYIWQMHWLMYVTGRKWCDYVGYCKELPCPADMWIWRLERDDKTIEQIDKMVAKFKTEFDQALIKLGFD